MDNLFINFFNSLDPNIIIIALSLLLVICWAVFKNRDSIKDFFDGIYNKRKSKENLLEIIHDNQADIKQIIENRIHDREQSFAIQKELTDAQKELSEAIYSISKKLDEMQKSTDERFEESERKNNKRIRAELKDKIGQSYRYYHSSGKINDMEFEALEDLIAEYESADGENSFIHSVVQKEMYTWEKVQRV